MFRSEGFQKYFKNFSWLFADRVLRMLLVLVTTIVVSRYLGVERIGQLNYALAIVSIAMVLTSLGANEIISRDLVRHPERRDELLGSSFAIKLAGGVVLNLALLAFVLLKDLDMLTILLVMITAVGELFKWSTVIDYYFLSQVKGRTAAQVNILSSMISSGYKLLLVYYQAPLLWFAWGYMTEILSYTICYVIAYRHHGLHIRKWRPSWRMVRYVLDQSWPMLIYGFALQAQLKIDQVMIFDILKGVSGDRAAHAELGQYSVAVKMIEAMAFLPVVLQISLAPAIARARIQDIDLYHQRITNQYRIMFMLYLATAIPLFFLAEPIIVMLYGPEFNEAGVLLSWFAFRLLFSFMGVAKGSFITNEGLFKFSLVTAVIGAVVNIGLNVVLIPAMGSFGAIWANVASFLISIYVVDLFTARTRINFRMMTLGMFTFWKIRSVR
ncbi:MAG TPA: flippase [Flavobacteriales bacterium]|nr:flippase [Flavobacteriales bacterium]